MFAVKKRLSYLLCTYGAVETYGSSVLPAKLRLFVGLCHLFISCIMFNKKLIYCRETGLQQLAIVVQGTVT